MRHATARRVSARATVVALTALLTLSPGARSDDTEVFVAPAGTGGRSNILFIIDTSASMDAEVETQALWDPASTFTGCYRSDAVYFGTGAQPPPCESTAFALKTANECAASRSALDSLGQYSGFVLGWDATRERWDTLIENEPERMLECRDDRGEDGDGSERWAANGPDGPWGPDAGQEPAWNVQYTLFDGNWLNWNTNPPTITRTRLQIVQEVVSDIVANLTGVNVGLMEFNREDGGNVSQAIADVETTRSAMIAAVSRMVTQGRTPLSETLYEATQYFRGGRVDYGNIGPAFSVPESRINGDPAGESYLSPVTAECQKNFIVLLTDGEPLGDLGANARIEALPGFASLIGNCDGTGEGNCLDDLAEYLLRSDASAGLDGLQSVVTYTIGFGGVDTPLLESTARRGGGQYYVADDTGSLAAVMTEVVTGIAERSGTFAAPAIPVSAYNRASAERDVYVSVFQPTATVHWPGNLKKYRFSGTELIGEDGRSVVDPTTGFFRPTAFSFWSGEPDGDRVADGGAANRQPAVADRNIYTDIVGDDDAPIALTASGNRVAVDNSGLTAAMLGVVPDQRARLISWILGSDVTDLDRDGNVTEPRRQMGDPLHVRPVTLSYGSSAENPDTAVFVATNDGLLHSIDADTGEENWAYLPSRLLLRQSELLQNASTPVRHYGLDGEIRLAILNDDGVPGITRGRERAVLYFGMGRGGDAVFALDVTEPAAPILLWQIDRSEPGFEHIGQTWAAPEIARVRISDVERSVVLLSGGYDDSQDNDATADGTGYRTDTVGNALFMVDALTGERIWSAGPGSAAPTLELPSMQHSIPAAPRVIDLTGDGFADRLYVGDMGGRLWRFDIRNGNPAGTLVDGGVLASLGAADLGERTAADVRRFYATPDAVFVNCRRGTFLAVNIGSGYRGHPLDTDVEDALFSVRDPNPFGALDTADYPEEPVTVDDLLDITDDPEADVPADAAGWRLRLVEDPGEKSLTGAITFDSTVFFTTFAPGGNVSACVGGLGVNRAYQVDACTGRPVNNLDGSTEPGPLGTDDRFVTLNQTGIAPQTVLVFPSAVSQGPIRCIGLICFSDENGAGRNLRRTYWTQEPSR